MTDARISQIAAQNHWLWAAFKLCNTTLLFVSEKLGHINKSALQRLFDMV
jgi:hypothetical protein